MKQEPFSLELETFSDHRVWTLDGVPVLEANLELPRPARRDRRPDRQLDRFYQLQGRFWFRYCERFLFPRAAKLCQTALDNAQPMPECRAALVWRETWNRDGFLSLYTQSREVCGGPAVQTRWGDTWRLPEAAAVPLTACFPRRTPIRKLLCTAAAEEIERQERAGTARYCEKWRWKLRHAWNARNFCLTETGLAYFWPMYAIAPAAEGIPTFVLPWGEQGCHLPDLRVLGLA